MTSGEGRGLTGALPSSLSPGFWVKVGALALLDALVVFAIPTLFAEESWLLLTAMVLSAGALNWAYLSPKAKASKWLMPGLILMFLFVLYPVVYTFYVSLTNWSTGNVLTKEQAITQLERREIQTEAGAVPLEFFLYEDPAGELRMLVRDPEGEVYFGIPRGQQEDPLDEPLVDLAGEAVIDEDGDGIPEEVGDFTRLGPLQVTGLAARGVLEGLTLDIPGRGVAQVQTTSAARLIESGRRYFYDPETDTVYDAQLDVTCEVEIGNFVCPDGRRIDPGWRVVIGFEQYGQILGNPRIRGPFISVFSWNVVFAALSVVFTFALGLALANALQDDRVRGRAFYRSVYIIPYAIPAFLSILVWRGLLNARFGQVNRLLLDIGFDPIPWLTHPFWAKVAVLLVNTWLGFPYMFLITSGALTAIPTELKEAARVDGASAWRVFRTITLPLLLVSTSPLLIGAFAFNFNNFVLIFLLTNGGPPIPNPDVPLGATDILISFTFNIAVQAGRGNNFARGSAIVVMIFIIVAVLSALSFRWTKRLEDVYGNV